nr:hypothetical protein GCM10020093_042570 [Planobispora longispora]
MSVTRRAVEAWRGLIGSGEQHLFVGGPGGEPEGEIAGFSLHGPARDAGIDGGEVYAIYVLAATGPRGWAWP